MSEAPSKRHCVAAAWEAVNREMPKAVRIYTTTYCTFCRLAKDLLRERRIPFEDLDVTEDDEARRWLVEATGRRTVPQIFIGAKAIGGYEELRALDEAGLLAARVADGTPNA